jgi:hypothetical protein
MMGQNGSSDIDNTEGLPALDYDVVHVDGGEPVEVGGEGDEVHRVVLVELVHHRTVLVVVLPPQLPQLRL